MDVFYCQALVSTVTAVLLELILSHTRGEDPIGAWTLEVSDQNDEQYVGSFVAWQMSLWGSATKNLSTEGTVSTSAVPGPATWTSTAHPSPSALEEDTELQSPDLNWMVITAIYEHKPLFVSIAALLLVIFGFVVWTWTWRNERRNGSYELLTPLSANI